MVKCEICGNKIEKTFLDKIKGTFVKGKAICDNCQREHKDKIMTKAL